MAPAGGAASAGEAAPLRKSLVTKGSAAATQAREAERGMASAAQSEGARGAPQALRKFLVPKGSSAAALALEAKRCTPSMQVPPVCEAIGAALPPAPPARALEACPSAAARLVLLYAASYGLDTRLGIICFDVEADLVLLDLERLKRAVKACSAREHHSRFENAVKELSVERRAGLLNIRPGGASPPAPLARARLGVWPLTQPDLEELRRSATVGGLEVAGQQHPHALLRKLRDQVGKLPHHEAAKACSEGVPAWGHPLLSDHLAAHRRLPAFLARLTGAEPSPLVFHIRFGLRSTEQRLRSAQEYAQDFRQVGGAVEALEALVGDAYVPRPPAAREER